MKLIIAVIMAFSTLFIACSEEKKQPTPPAPMGKSDIELLREKIAADPRDTTALFHLSDMYERLTMYPEEIDTLKKIIAVKPDTGYAYFKLGAAYNRLGRHQEAVSYYLKATKYPPQQPMLYNNLAVSYGKLGKVDEEIAALRKAISLRPKYAIARMNLGFAQLKKGDRKAALEQYEALKLMDEGAAVSLKKEIDGKRK